MVSLLPQKDRTLLVETHSGTHVGNHKVKDGNEEHASSEVPLIL